VSGDDDRAGRLAWFDELYRRAEANADNVPWSRAGPHPGLEYWVARAATNPGKAIDVGCGLGDNAAYLAELGYEVTAFDLSETAIDWAKQRFTGSGIDFVTADLFALPAHWRGAFDLVSEVYTLQALPADLRQGALEKIAGLPAPGGRIVVVCMARDEDEEPDGPPWPLARSELDGFMAAGLQEALFADVVLGENRRRHFVVEYRRP
jgi:SAM-dependent methyltransferase